MALVEPPIAFNVRIAFLNDASEMIFEGVKSFSPYQQLFFQFRLQPVCARHYLKELMRSQVKQTRVLQPSAQQSLLSPLYYMNQDRNLDNFQIHSTHLLKFCQICTLAIFATSRCLCQFFSFECCDWSSTGYQHNGGQV